MLAIKVAAHRKMFILSVGLFCLPHVVLGMEGQYPIEFDSSNTPNSSITTNVLSNIATNQQKKYSPSKLNQKNRTPTSRQPTMNSNQEGQNQNTQNNQNKKTRPRSASATNTSININASGRQQKIIDSSQTKSNESEPQQTASIPDAHTPTTEKEIPNPKNLLQITPANNNPQKPSMLEKAANLFDPDEKKLNDNISIKFKQMKINPLHELLTKKTLKTLTPLQLLALQFYIKTTEVHRILLLDLVPILESENPIKPGELGLFLEDEKLYCMAHDEKPLEIMRADDPFVLSYRAESYDRIQETLKSKNTSSRYNLALQKRSAERHELFKTSEDCGPEALAELDAENLLRYTTQQNYSLKLKEIAVFINAKGENIEKIKTEDLLKKFWNYDFKENWLSSCNFKDINFNTIELIGSSVKFLINHITCTEKQRYLSKTLCEFYNKLSKRFPEEQKYVYQNAKYLTTLAPFDTKNTQVFYKRAWELINKCDLDQFVSLSDTDADPRQELAWHKQLKLGYMSYVNSSKDSKFKGESNLQIARFAQIINKLSNKFDKSEQEGSSQIDLEMIDYFLEGVKHLYDHAQSLVSNESKNAAKGWDLVSKEIEGWDHHTRLTIACKAFSRGKIEAGSNEAQYLNISRDFINELIKQKKTTSPDSIIVIEEVLNSPHSNKSLDLLHLSTFTLTGLAQMIKGITEHNEAARSLYIKLYHKIACLYYDFENTKGNGSAKEECLKWDKEIIKKTIDYAINDTSPMTPLLIRDNMIHELCKKLIDKKYQSDIYLSVMAYYKNRQMPVTAFNIACATENLMGCEKEKETYKSLKKAIDESVTEVKKYKISLGEAFQKMIDMLTTKKPLSAQQIKHWTEKCPLVTQEQLNTLESNRDKLEQQTALFRELKSETSFNFKNLETIDYRKQLYEMFGLGLPSKEWMPEAYIISESEDTNNLIDPCESFDELSATEISKSTDISQVDENTKKAIHRMSEKGYSNDQILEIYDELSLEQIKAILSEKV